LERLILGAIALAALLVCRKRRGYRDAVVKQLAEAYNPTMTKLVQKKRERFFAEEAARLLGTAWDLGGDREHPDFIVTDGNKQFGLEITQIFVGPQGSSGSFVKAAETKTQRIINELQRRYETIENIPLIVKFVGNIEADNMATLIPALLAQDLPSKPLCYSFVHDTTIAHPIRSRLRVHVTKGLRPNWFSVNDRAGPVDRRPHAIIATAIAKKANDLPRYEDAAGRDVRLLLIADRISNSGKLTLEEDAQFDFHGFRAVYLCPYPENVTVLTSAGSRMAAGSPADAPEAGPGWA
jgi:hypothetical protein